jgi:predicted kinase
MIDPMPTVVVPDPAVVVLIGPAGSGKTTFAERHFAAEEVLASDAFRELIAGDAADQRATRPAFARLNRELRTRLGRGLLTVIDATSLSRASRRELLDAATVAGVPAVAVVLDLPRPLVHARNAARTRVVRRDVVDDQLVRLRALLDRGELLDEGFAQVVWLRSPRAVDEVRVVRSVRAPARPRSGRSRPARGRSRPRGSG